MILTILLVSCLICVCVSKQYVLLPYDSYHCMNHSKNVHEYYEFTVNQQINLITDDNITDTLSGIQPISAPRFQISSANYKYYLCRTLLKPMGRSSESHEFTGYYSFWNVRLQIDRIRGLSNCNDYLLIQFRHEHNLITTLEGNSDDTRNITCHDPLPIVVPSQQRKVYITYFSYDSNSRCGFTINVTSFIYFKGDFTDKYQQDKCRQQDGFWCVNSTACIFRDMKCDGYDSCFDGGSDEADCYITSNLTIPIINVKSSSRFIDYLPWLAVGILPLILLLALICICSQHRSEVYFDEEEDNLDVEKSHDGDDMWSSADGLEKSGGDAIEEDEEEEDNGGAGGGGDEWVAKKDNGLRVMDYDGSIGLVPLGKRDCTTKAHVSTSHTLQSINKDYEDIDQPGELPNVSNSHCDRTTDHNIMSVSQMTDDDYEDHLEDVGSLLRKVDKTKIPEEVRLTASRGSMPGDAVGAVSVTDSGVDYRSDYILV